MSSTPPMPAARPDEQPRPKRPGVRPCPDEAWVFIEAHHTGIVTTLRRSWDNARLFAPR